MPTQVSFPPGVCDATQAVAVKRFRAKKHAGRLLISAMLVVVSLVLAGCSGAEAQERGVSAADLQRAAANAWNCPGMHAEWLDEFTVQCLKEKP